MLIAAEFSLARQWDTAASLAAITVNASNAIIEAVYRAAGAKSVRTPKTATPADFHPYEEAAGQAARRRRGGGIPLTKSNWHNLKALAGDNLEVKTI